MAHRKPAVQGRACAQVASEACKDTRTDMRKRGVPMKNLACGKTKAIVAARVGGAAAVCKPASGSER